MKKRQLSRTQKVLPFAASLLLSLVLFMMGGFAIHNFSPLENLELFFYDTFMNMRNAGDYGKYQSLMERFQDRMFIVTISDSTLQEFGRFSEWSREKTGKLINKLHDAGARVIFVDALFTEASRDVDTDRDLAEAYVEIPGVILPAKVWRARERDIDAHVELPLFHITSSEYPMEILGDLYRNRAGIVAVDEIRGGRVRSIPLAAQVGEKSFIYNVSLLSYLACRDLNTGDIVLSRNGLMAGDTFIPLRDEKFYINYTIKHLTMEPGQSYTDLFPLCDTGPMEFILSLDTADLKSLVKDRIVMVGAATPSLGDIKDTPMGPMPGVYINAMTVANMLERMFIRFTSPWVNLTIMIVLGLLLTLATCFLRPLWAGFAGIALGGSYFWGAYQLFRVHSMVVPAAPALISIALHILLLVSYFYILEEQQKNKIKGIFGEYLSPVVVESLLQHQVKGDLGIEGKSEVVSIFYSDIRGFTSMSENMKPEEVVALLNEYFDRMAEIVIRHGGYIDKYIGDCLMAIFTAPVPTPDDPVNAAIAAVEQQEEIMRLKAKWRKQGRDKFFVGMGINTGQVILGNIGSPKKKDYTVIGDNVNLAARLYDQARGGQILISEATYELIKDQFECSFVDTLTVKGKTIPVRVYEILGRKGEKNLLEGYDKGPRQGGH